MSERESGLKRLALDGRTLLALLMSGLLAARDALSPLRNMLLAPFVPDQLL